VSSPCPGAPGPRFPGPFPEQFPNRARELPDPAQELPDLLRELPNLFVRTLWWMDKPDTQGLAKIVESSSYEDMLIVLSKLEDLWLVFRGVAAWVFEGTQWILGSGLFVGVSILSGVVQ
jgi:hypothetical protein